MSLVQYYIPGSILGSRASIIHLNMQLFSILFIMPRDKHMAGYLIESISHCVHVKNMLASRWY